MGDKQIAVYEEPMAIEQLQQQVQVIQQVMAAVMKKDEHYGVIPGTEKPSLLKPGAEKLGMTFRLAPTYAVTKRDLPNNHREYEVVCTLTHIGSGAVVGQGVGLCSTMETKYRWRQSKRVCPACGMETVILGKAEYGGGYICWKKQGGCGAKFPEGDPNMMEQKVGKIENPDVADCYNTVLKMAKKRAHVDAILTATAASDIFAQDIEDLNQQPDGASQRERLLNRAKAAIEQGAFTEDQIKAYHQECKDTRDNDKLLEIVNEIERELLAQIGQGLVDANPGKEPDVPSSQGDDLFEGKEVPF